MSSSKNWMQQIPDDDLDKLLDGLSCYMLFQAELYGRLMDEKWRRHGTPLTEWPVARSPTDNPIHDLRFVRYCFKAQSPADDEHRPSRILGEDRECSCGIRDGDARHQFGIENYWRAPGPIWWPTETRDGVVHYGVCPDAKHADDHDHAPMYFTEHWGEDEPRLVRCVCRRVYAIRALEEGEPRAIKYANWMPAH